MSNGWVNTAFMRAQMTSCQHGQSMAGGKCYNSSYIWTSLLSKELTDPTWVSFLQKSNS